MALPGILFVFIFNYLPIFGIVIAFKNFVPAKGFFGSAWVGFSNFRFLFNSPDIWRVTRNTVVLNALFIITGTIIAVTFAILLNEIRKKIFTKFYQTVFFFPYFLSWVVVGYIFYALFSVEYGITNSIFSFFGKEPVQWYTQASYWPALLVFANIWKTVGYSSVIYYAGIMSIDSEYYEAAEIDGASKLQMVTHITIPLIVPLISILTILAIGKIFYSDFGMFFQLTRDSGLLYSTTDVIDTYVYRSLRQVGNIGMSSAAGLYQSIVGFILVLATNTIVKKLNPENSLF